MKDLLELVCQREEDDAAYRQQLRQLTLMMMRRDGPVHPAQIVAVLRRKIDQDLLFTDDFPLVETLVHQIVAEEWDAALKKESLYVTERARETAINASVKLIRRILGELRHRYLEYRDGDRQLDF